MTEAYVLLGTLWVACALGTGYVLAMLARRIHPSLSFRKLWIFYSGLMACFVGLVVIVGWW